jgi:hypothetical protein
MDARQFGQRLSDVPTELGEWQLRESRELDKQIVEILQCADYLHGTYVHRQTGESVNVALVCGPAGPISVHTPEICYSSRGYETREKRERRDVSTAGGQADQFWTVTLKSSGVDGETLNVYYAWNGGNGWVAPRQPRIYFAGKPFLYKIQLAANTPPHFGPNDEDTCTSFLVEFLPAVQPYLIAQQSADTNDGESGLE